MAHDMTAAVLYGKQDVRLERVPVPEAGVGEVVIRVGVALTCGTDLKVFRRGYHARMVALPALFGHEVGGTVHQVGEGVTQFAVGDRVVALNSAPCEVCFFCRHGQQNLCDDLHFNNGAYAEYIRVPARIVERNMLHVDDHVPLEHAALTEPLACVVLGFEETGAKVGDTMAVIGAGPIGLMFIHVAALAGVEVIAVVKRSQQAEAALQLGAKECVQVDETRDVVGSVRALTENGRGADIVVEAVAIPQTWQWSVDMVRKGGVVNFFGGPASGTRVELDTNLLHYSNLSLKATFHHTPATVRTAYQLIASERFRAAEFITGRAELESVPDVLRRMMDRDDEAGKVDIKTAIFPDKDNTAA